MIEQEEGEVNGYGDRKPPLLLARLVRGEGQEGDGSQQDVWVE
jgi:hypothetical protein